MDFSIENLVARFDRQVIRTTRHLVDRRLSLLDLVLAVGNDSVECGNSYFLLREIGPQLRQPLLAFGNQPSRMFMRQSCGEPPGNDAVARGFGVLTVQVADLSETVELVAKFT